MKLVIFFLLGWLVVGFLAAVAIGKVIREIGLNVADDEYPDRRIKMRRATVKRSADAPPPPTQGERRRESDRRKDNHRQRQRKDRST